jgi:Carbohydrate-selective porin, OprB family/S-layer homology domain
MSRRKVAPWLLAASVFLTGTTGILTGVMSPAHAITSVEELRDVDTSSWAYQALADLVEKYDVIEGYPNYTFKGNKPATRYEMAAALNALIKSVGRDLARLGAEKANKSDLATIARLQEEFRNELAALNARESAMESRASAIEAKNTEQDNRLDLLERTQLHGDLSFGILGDASSNGLQFRGKSGPTGIQDSMTALGRMRLSMKVPVVPGYDNSAIGEGDVIARLVAAFGSWVPDGVNGGGTGPSTKFTGAFMPISGYSAIAGGGSVFNEGVASSSAQGLNKVIGGDNLQQNLYLETAYYKQHFKSGIPLLTDLLPGISLFPDNDHYRTTADVYLGVMPWRNLFDRSPYRGDEMNQFQNTALVNNQGLLVNTIDPTLAIAWHQGLGEHLGADLTGAVRTMDMSDIMTGFNISEELAFNYDTAFLGKCYDKPGSFFVGGYHIFFAGNENLDQLATNASLTAAVPGLGLVNRVGYGLPFNGTDANRTLNAYYVGWNQEWWRGIGTSVDWVQNQSNKNNAVLMALMNGTGVNASFLNNGAIVGVQDSLSAALSVPMTAINPKLTNRAKDTFGLGYSLIAPTEGQDAYQGQSPAAVGSTVGIATAGNTYTAYSGGRVEQVVEAYYRWAINNSFSIVPSAQLIFNRMGVAQNGTDWVYGIRTNYVF